MKINLGQKVKNCSIKTIGLTHTQLEEIYNDPNGELIGDGFLGAVKVSETFKDELIYTTLKELCISEGFYISPENEGEYNLWWEDLFEIITIKNDHYLYCAKRFKKDCFRGLSSNVWRELTNIFGTEQFLLKSEFETIRRDHNNEKEQL